MTEPNEAGPEGVKKSIWTPRKILSLFLAAIVLAFLLQNLAIVEVDFLAWSIRMPRALLVTIVLLVGVALGLLLGKTTHRKSS